MDTSKILFICGGAFVGLDKVIQRRCGKQVLGFKRLAEDGTDRKAEADAEAIRTNPLDFCEPEDLIRFGLIPEFIGRLPVVTALEPLSKEDLLKILVEPKNAVTRQYAKLLAMENVKLTFRDDALERLAELAYQKGTGARGLRSLIENVMVDIMFNVPSADGVLECIITADTVNGGEPQLVRAKKKK